MGTTATTVATVTAAKLSVARNAATDCLGTFFLDCTTTSHDIFMAPIVPHGLVAGTTHPIYTVNVIPRDEAPFTDLISSKLVMPES